MIFAAILAGGLGNRMGEVDKPKQFFVLGDKPIIIQTIEKFYLHSEFDLIIVLSPKSYINYTKDLIEEYIPNAENIVVIESGELRNDTIFNAIKYIESNYTISDDDIIVTHDAVRPFITHRILMENINKTQKFGACDTVIPATDTIVSSRDSKLINVIPNRQYIYQGQTPQSFKILKLKECYNNLSDDEKESLTDACKILVLNDEDVAIVKGEVFNIKITYPYDLKVANAIIKEFSSDLYNFKDENSEYTIYDFENKHNYDL